MSSTKTIRKDFDLSYLYELAFGYRGSPFFALPQNEKYIGGEFEENSILNEQVGEKEEFDQNNQLLNTSIEEGVIRRFSELGKPLFMPVAIGNQFLPNEPIVEIRASKNIVETPLTGGQQRQGSIKELININDYDINIRGIAINKTNLNNYPNKQIQQIVELWNKNESLEIISDITNFFNIERIVIKEFNLPEMVGIQHAQAYEFKCLSDTDFVLELE